MVIVGKKANNFTIKNYHKIFVHRKDRNFDEMRLGIDKINFICQWAIILRYKGFAKSLQNEIVEYKPLQYKTIKKIENIDFSHKINCLPRIKPYYQVKEISKNPVFSPIIYFFSHVYMAYYSVNYNLQFGKQIIFIERSHGQIATAWSHKLNLINLKHNG